MSPITKQRIVNVGFIGLYAFAMWVLSLRPIELTWKNIFLLVGCVMSIGPAVAYLVIGEAFRWPFTHVVKHSNGANESNEPLYSEGPAYFVGILLSCPLCSGEFFTTVLLVFRVFFPGVGDAAILALGIAGYGWLGNRIREWFEARRNVEDELNGIYHRQNLVERSIYVKRNGREVTYERVDHAEKVRL